MNELPVVDENLESHIKGLYVVGDLTGLPLIKTAANQGYDVIGRITKLRGETSVGDYDVIIVGGGASGLAAAIEASKRKLDYLIIEKMSLANTVKEFTRGKLILAEPDNLEVKSDLWVKEATKEEYEREWARQIKDYKLDYHEGESVEEVKKEGDLFQVRTDKGQYTSSYVIIALGSQGNPRKLNIPGEDLDKVHYKLDDPDEFRGKDIVVVGGGDRSCETVFSLAQNNNVTLIVRKERLTRPKHENKDKIAKLEAEGRINVLYNTKPKRIGEREVMVERNGKTESIPNDVVFINAGPILPTGFLRKIGFKFENDWDTARYAKVGAFLAIVLSLLYIKKFTDWTLFGSPMWFWYTFLYTAVVVIWGVHAIRKYKTGYVKVRTAFNIFSQALILFIIPEFILKDWRAYGIGLPWPLNMWTIVYNDSLLWVAFAFFSVFLLVPFLVLRYGKGVYCSWICGCGCLAETLGDSTRHYSPKGTKATEKNWIIYPFLVLSTIVTVYILFAGQPTVDWQAGKIDWRGWSETHWSMDFYDIYVDFLLASVVGIGVYPIWGARIWCRYICPFAAYMNRLGKKSRFKILADHKKCITCGRCNKYCEMGIDVQYAGSTGETITNANSVCVGCGLCVEVCPTKVLSIKYE